jgi:hypothetical protein
MNKPTLVLQAPVSSRSGYGDHSRDLLRSLKKMDKYDIKIIPTRWGTTPQDQLVVGNDFDEWVLSKIVSTLTQRPDIYMQVSVANEFQPVGMYNIGITAGVETTVVPKEFMDGANKMNLIIVPSEFTKSVMQSTQYQEKNNKTDEIIATHKITVPIEVLHEGVDLDTFLSPPKSTTDILDAVDSDFCFLAVGHWLKGDLGHDRKDIGMLIKTFGTVFKFLPKEKRPALILKTSQAGFSLIDRDTMLARIKDVLSPLGDNVPDVYLLHGDLTTTEMAQLYHHDKVKAMVSFTKGEGYGRPLAEFCVTGKPVIVSKWSGHTDFLPEQFTTYIDGSLSNVHPSAVDKFLIKESKWFSVNYSDAANKLLNVYTDYASELKRSYGLIRNIKTNFSLDVQTTKFSEILDRYVNNQPKFQTIQLPKLELPKLEKLN